jgi:tRNA(fMet)-specific endonuclease VapC
MIHLLDTDTFILLLRGTGISAARSAREKAVKLSAGKILARCKEQSAKGHPIGLSAISLAELEFGLRHGGHYDKHHKALRQVLAPFQTFPFDAVDCVHHYGIVRSALEKKGNGIGPLDTLIAAHALALGAVLVTHNTREFKRVPGLAIEDWA